MSKQELVEKVFRWVRLNTEVDGFDFQDFLCTLKEEIDKRIENDT